MHMHSCHRCDCTNTMHFSTLNHSRTSWTRAWRPPADGGVGSTSLGDYCSSWWSLSSTTLTPTTPRWDKQSYLTPTTLNDKCNKQYYHKNQSLLIFILFLPFTACSACCGSPSLSGVRQCPAISENVNKCHWGISIAGSPPANWALSELGRKEPIIHSHTCWALSADSIHSCNDVHHWKGGYPYLVRIVAIGI